MRGWPRRCAARLPAAASRLPVAAASPVTGMPTYIDSARSTAYVSCQIPTAPGTLRALRFARAAAVLGQLDDPPESAHDFLGAAHHALGTQDPDQDSHPRADALLDELGWEVDPLDHEARFRLEKALAGLEDAGFPVTRELLETYGAAMHSVAAREVQGVPLESPAEALRYVVLGTVLIEPVLLALRRLAQQDVSGRLFARTGPPGPAVEGPGPQAS